MVGLPGGVLVEGLEVYGPPERPVLLGADHHSVAPSDGRAQGDLFQHAETDVPVQPCLYLLLPVNGYGDGGVARFGGGVRVDLQ